MDWQDWHRAYETSLTLQARLRLVQAQLARALDACPDGPVHVISLCAGDGRDLIGVLAHHPRAAHTTAFLIERDPGLVAAGQAMAAQRNFTEQVQFVQADATQAATYVGMAPAAIVLVCGVFGNLRADQTPLLIQHLRGICAPEGAVIWTRGLFQPADPERLAQLQASFVAAGFTAQDTAATDPAGFIVATHRMHGPPASLPARGTLFTFTGYNQLGENDA